MKRITPAHAGKRKEKNNGKQQQRDHPRACGEKPTLTITECCEVGSPPRMRGKVVYECFLYRGHGITPAHAGKSASFFYLHFFD